MPDPVHDLSAALEAAVVALAPLLPSEHGLTPAGAPSVHADLAAALPGGARVVAGRLGGLEGATLVVALAEELADVLEQGPRGMLDLGDVLRPALAAAADAMSPRLGPLSLESSSALGAGDPVPSGDVAAAALVDGERSAVTVALVVPAGALAGPDDAPLPPVPTPAAFHALADALPGSAGGAGGISRSLDLLHDVEMGVTAELGRTRLTVRNLLGLAPGSVVELDRAAGSQVDLLVNGTLIARGEVVVIDDEFGVRISEVVGGVGGEGRR